jgi:hypothetical protein
LRKTGIEEDGHQGRRASRKTGIKEDGHQGRRASRKTGIKEDGPKGRCLVPQLRDDVDYNPTRKILDWRLMIEDW